MAFGRERILGIYNGMHTRCENAKRKDYPRYGGRGITVCDEWSGKGSFARFYEWAIENGYSDNLTLDRIDGDCGYSPQNCRWVTLSEQCRNRSNNHLLEYNGETKTMTEWSEIAGIRKDTFRRRIVNCGWSMKAALETPVKQRKAVNHHRNG